MSEPLLVLEDVHGYYGTAHVLHDVSLSMGAEPIALIGRNGMGKTTLCKAIVGLLASASARGICDSSPPPRTMACASARRPWAGRLGWTRERTIS